MEEVLPSYPSIDGLQNDSYDPNQSTTTRVYEDDKIPHILLAGKQHGIPMAIAVENDDNNHSNDRQETADRSLPIPEDVAKMAKRIRLFSYPMLLFSTLACVTPGILFGPPIDLFFILVNFIIIHTSTRNAWKLIGDEQYLCGGFRHVYGLAVTSLVFLAIMAIIRVSTSFVRFYVAFDASLGMSFEGQNKPIVITLILQSIATCSTGICFYCVWIIASLSSPSKSKQCFTNRMVIDDPKHPEYLKSSCCVIPRFGTIMIAVFTFVTIGLLIAFTPFHTCDEFDLARIESCCEVVNSTKVFCQHVAGNPIQPFIDDNDCLCEGGDLCADFELTFPTTTGNIETLIDTMYKLQDSSRVSSCFVDYSCTKGFNVFDGEVFKGNKVFCPRSMYNCSLVGFQDGFYCPKSREDRFYIS